jgi:hypothetical protein
MPRNVKVIRGPDFVRARPDGHVDLEAAEALLEEIAAAGVGLEDFQVRIYIRQVSGRLGGNYGGSREARQLARALGHRTAVLCPLEKFDHTRFFTMCAEARASRHVTAYEDAMEWLLASAA